MHKQCGRIDQFVKIFQALLGLAFLGTGFILVMRDQTAMCQYVLQYFGQRKFARRAAQRLDQCHERGSLAARSRSCVE